MLAHAADLNGPAYWKWPWREMSAIRWYPAMLLAASPILGALFLNRIRRTPALAIVLLMIGSIAIKLTSVALVASPAGFEKLKRIVMNPLATSYFTDAQRLRGKTNYLAMYPKILPLANLHTQSKPPGAVVYFDLFLRAYGDPNRAAMASGIGLAILASLSIAAVYSFARRLRCTRSTSLLAASIVALTPGFALVFPAFDAIWLAWTCAMLGTWHAALSRNDRRWSCALGVVLFVVTFYTYNVLVLGLLMVVMPCLTDARNSSASRFQRAILHGLIALAVCVACYGVLGLLTGFDPINTFIIAWRNQHALLDQHRDQRPYPWTILFDLTDFALGGGWIVLLPIAAWLMRRTHAANRRLLIAGLLIPIAVAVLGVLQSETARVWAFMLPLLAIPAAIELRRRSSTARAVFLGCMLAILLIVVQNMIFMND